ncbi:MAG: hypothetical protein KJ077_19765 [Anaerolineae bacterium]|nr:hypothetical protein [Anaerolineae bacterium]
MDTYDASQIDWERVKKALEGPDPQALEAIKKFVQKCDGPFFCGDPFNCGPKLWGPVDCGLKLWNPPCNRSFFEAITEDLLTCGGDFYRACNFGKLTEPHCYFQPVINYKDWKIQEPINELQVKVKELETRLAKSH